MNIHMSLESTRKGEFYNLHVYIIGAGEEKHFVQEVRMRCWQSELEQVMELGRQFFTEEFRKEAMREELGKAKNTTAYILAEAISDSKKPANNVSDIRGR